MLALLNSPLSFSTIPGYSDPTSGGPAEQNPCHDMVKMSTLNDVAGNADKNYDGGKVVNLPCFEDDADVTAAVGPQAGADVTPGKPGMIDSSGMPAIQGDLKAAGLCAVNVHWHEGAEHRSDGTLGYNPSGVGPGLGNEGYHGPDSDYGRRLGTGGQTQGHHCHYYKDFTAAQKEQYPWEHCKNMHVGETYEIHWPHSAAGACGTKWQFQSPFYDGVLCNDPAVVGVYTGDSGVSGAENSLNNMAMAVGVEGQVFTVVNDPAYDVHLGIDGAIKGGNFWQDVAKYTGSTTGQSRDNKICSVYTPITWQVDRKCHMISAKSFDLLCAQMKTQADDPNDNHDLEPHGARLTVPASLTATNIEDGVNRA